jgi:hypothetical protein
VEEKHFIKLPETTSLGSLKNAIWDGIFLGSFPCISATAQKEN